jgi:hypothetical protein
MMKVGKIYRLKFPGIAARAIEPLHGLAPKNYPFLMESIFLRSRWYVNARGEPLYPDAPRLVLRTTDRAALTVRRPDAPTRKTRCRASRSA